MNSFYWSLASGVHPSDDLFRPSSLHADISWYSFLYRTFSSVLFLVHKYMYMNVIERKYNVVGRKNTVNRTMKFKLILLGIWMRVLISVEYFGSNHPILALSILFNILLYVLHDMIFNFTDCFSSFLGYSKLITKFVCFRSNQR